MQTNLPVPFDFCVADPSRGLLRDCTTGCGTDGALHSTNLTAGHDQGLDDGVDEVAEVLLVAEEDGEPEREGNNEEENHDGDFDEGVAHIDEHHNIDSKEWHFPEHG